MRVVGAVLTALGIASIVAIQRLFPAFTTPEPQTLELDLLTMLGMLGTSVGLALLMVGRELIVRERDTPDLRGTTR